MSVSWASRLGLLLGPLLLSSCVSTTRDYVLGKMGFFSVRGKLIQVENLTSGEIEALADGTTVRIDQDGCLVTMQCGEESHEIEAGPGSIIVIGSEEDFLLQPIGESGSENNNSPESRESDPSSSDEPRS